MHEAVDWFVPDADTAVRAYLADPRSERDVAKALAAAWSLRGDVMKLLAERNSLRQQHYDAQKSGASHPEAAAKNAVFDRQIDDLDAKIDPATAHFKAALQGIVAPSKL
jgi:hypothetical protein